MSGRDYWAKVEIQPLAEDGQPDGHGVASGRRVRFRQSGEWMNDEEIRHIADDHAEALVGMLARARDKEMALAREAARPFWQRWLG